MNFNNFYANDPGYYCPNPMDYPQGSFPPNPLLNPRSLGLSAQNPQIPPGVDPIPTSNFNQTLDNIPSSAPIPISKYSKMSKNSSLNPPFVMPPLHGNAINQHYRLANHPSQKFFHYVNGSRIPQNVKNFYRKGSSALVNDIVTTNPLAMSEALVTDGTIGNARNFAVPSTSAEIAKQIGSKAEITTGKTEKIDSSSKTMKVTTTVKTEIPKKDEKSNSKETSPTSSNTVSTASMSTVTTTISTTAVSAAPVSIKTENKVSKMDIDVKTANPVTVKTENIKKEEITTTKTNVTLAESTKTITSTSNVETKATNAQVNVTTQAPAITTVASVDNIKAAPAAEVSKPPTTQANNVVVSAPTKQNSNTVTTNNGVVRVRKRHQVKVACGKYLNNIIYILNILNY